MSLLQHTRPPASAYSEKGWIQCISDHTRYIQTNQATLVEINEYKVYQKSNDFYGLLLTLNVERKYHLVYLIINGLSHPEQFDESVTHLYLPEIKYIDKLMKQYLTIR